MRIIKTVIVFTLILSFFIWDWFSLKDCYTTHQTGIILITDTSTGNIGRQAAFQLAHLNYTIFCGVLSQSEFYSLNEESQNRSLENYIIPVFLDVTKIDQIWEVFEKISSFKPFNSTEDLQFIGLINTAGLYEYSPLELYPLDKIRIIFEVNFWAAISLTQQFLPLLRQNQGRIIFLTSVLGYSPLGGTSIYSASKNALEGVIDALRLEIKSFGVAVVSIVPSRFSSPNMIGKKTEGFSSSSLDLYEKYKHYYTKEPLPNTIIGPEVITQAILQSITLSCPKSRYFVGDSLTLALILNALLPDRLLDLLKPLSFL